MALAAGAPTDVADVLAIQALTTGKPVVKLVQQVGSNQTGLTSGSDTVITFGAGSDEIDTHNLHDVSTNNSRITITTTGLYRVDIKPIMTASTTITSINSCLRKNGSNYERSGNHKPNATSSTNTAATPLSTLVSLVAGDFIEAVVTFQATANQSTNNTAGSMCTFQCVFERS